jgi:phosphate acyltransferase
MTTVIAVDCMGGDHGVSVTLPASVEFLASHPDCKIILVGQKDAILGQLPNTTEFSPQSGSNPQLTYYHAEQVVLMDDPPAVALRTKRQSSIRLAAQLVKEGAAHALVSAGNTGALMAISKLVLKMLPGIDRPAIAAQLPSFKNAAKTSGDGVVTMLDLGANVECSAEHFLQFGVMGSALANALDNNNAPRVGLLNVGQEIIKGSDVVKKAGLLLSQSQLNFIGNVEGDDIYKGTADVIVCDGFSGNVALKASEGLAQLIGRYLKEEYSRAWYTKAAALLSAPVLRRFKRRVDHRYYNGASLVGLQGVVIKSHGGADVLAFEHALRRAHDAVRNDFLGKISKTVSAFPSEIQ